MRYTLSCASLLVALAPGPAAAQGWPARVIMGINGAAQASTSTFEDEFTYQHPYSLNIPGEEARVASRYEIPIRALLDGGGAVRLFGNVGVGVSLSLGSGTEDIEIDASIPHPFLLARHREVEGTVRAEHLQRGVHLQGVYVIPVSEHVYVGLSGGPSYYRAEQRVVTTITVQESFPFDTATFGTANVQRLEDTGWGFNAGLDVGWMFNRRIGIGGLVRYSQATLTIEPSGRASRELDAGGLHVGGGARLAF